MPASPVTASARGAPAATASSALVARSSSSARPTKRDSRAPLAIVSALMACTGAARPAYGTVTENAYVAPAM